MTEKVYSSTGAELTDLGLRGGTFVSKYNPEMDVKAYEYLNKEHETIPTIAELCLVLGIGKSTLYEWVNDNKSQLLTDIVRAIKLKAEHKLVSGGLSKTMDSGMSRFILSAQHSYSQDNNNQGISVSVNRDNVEISTKGQTLTINNKE